MVFPNIPYRDATSQTDVLASSVGALTTGLRRLIPAMIGVTAVSALMSGGLGGIVGNSGAVANGMLRLRAALEEAFAPLTLWAEEALIRLAENMPDIIKNIQEFLSPLATAFQTAWRWGGNFAAILQGIADAAGAIKFPELPSWLTGGGGGDRPAGGGGDEGLGAGGQGGRTGNPWLDFFGVNRIEPANPFDLDFTRFSNPPTWMRNAADFLRSVDEHGRLNWQFTAPGGTSWDDLVNAWTSGDTGFLRNFTGQALNPGNWGVRAYNPFFGDLYNNPANSLANPLFDAAPSSGYGAASSPVQSQPPGNTYINNQFVVPDRSMQRQAERALEDVGLQQRINGGP